jgi:hypothetical protein
MVPVSLRERIGRILENIGRFILTFIYYLANVVFGCVLFMLMMFAVAPRRYIARFERQKLTIPQDTGPESVSFLYGPGIYIAWLLCTLSAFIGSATDNTSFKVPPDLIVSVLYSTCSMYWYLIRCYQHPFGDPDAIQDYVIHAASFVLSVSTLIHGLGFIFTQKFVWILLFLWDGWVLWISPMTIVHKVPEIINFAGIPIMMLSIAFLGAVVIKNPWKSSPLILLPFALFEAIRCQFSTTWIFIIPKTASSLIDSDQVLSLVFVIALIIYRWELWRLSGIDRIFQKKFRRAPVRSKTIELEANPLTSYEISEGKTETD